MAVVLAFFFFLTSPSFAHPVVPLEASLSSLEANLENYYEAIGHYGFRASDIHTHTEETLKNIPVEALDAFLKGTLPENSQYYPTLRTLDLQLGQWTEWQKIFFEHYDEMTVAKTEFFIDQSMGYLDLVVSELKKILPFRQFWLLERSRNKASRFYKIYKENRDEYGKSKDTKRLTAYTKFFSSAAEFVESVDEVIVFGKLPVGSITRKLRDAFHALKVVTGFVLKSDSGLWTTVKNFFRAKPESKEFQNSLYNVGNIAKSFGSHLGHEVVLENEENLDRDSAKKDALYFYTPNHANLVFDLFTMGTVTANFPDMMAFSATHAQPKIFGIRKRIEKNEAIINVGKNLAGETQDAISILLDRLKNTSRRSVINYPEGSLPLGLGETRPVRDNFSFKLIQALRDQGTEVIITPLTSMDGYRFINSQYLQGPYEDGQGLLRLKVHKPISSPMIDMLLRHPLALNYFIRATWTESLSTNETHVFGQYRAKTLFSRLRDFLGKQFTLRSLDKCSKYLKAAHNSI